MTIEQALKFFNDFIETLKLNSEDKILNNDYCKASTKAIEALEKQIPKKPIYGDSNYRTEDNFLGREITCGKCSEQICYEHSVIEHFKFCNECGTKIDWEEI